MNVPISIRPGGSGVLSAYAGTPGDPTYRHLGGARRFRPGGTSGPWYWSIEVRGLQRLFGDARSKTDAIRELADLAAKAMTPTRLVTRKPFRSGSFHDSTDMVWVGRGSKWATPFRYRTDHGLARTPGAEDPNAAWEYEGRCSKAGYEHNFCHADGRYTRHTVRYMTRAECVELYEAAITGRPTPAMWGASPSNMWLGTWTEVEVVDEDSTVRTKQVWRPLTVADVRAELAGKNLACECPIGVVCHADVLLRYANSSSEDDK